MQELTPREVTAHLDRYVVGQAAAKRAVAVAIRNRIRRQRLDDEMARDVLPKNIILSGPTGVGKTEIARRMAGLLRAPFLKVEATKYTEVGYYGRDVETIARDLVELGVSMVQAEELERVKERAEQAVEECLLDALTGQSPVYSLDEEERSEREAERAGMRRRLRAGELEEERITLSLEDRSSTNMEVFSAMGVEQMGVDMQGFLDRIAPPRIVDRTIPVARAREALRRKESEALLDKEAVIHEAIRRVEQTGIVFIDEIDKVIAAGGEGPDVSRGGVQRDLLPLVEGCTVQTRHGPVRTDHVLFIAAGAFSVTRPEDLLPEFQGRFPLRVELSPLGAGEFVRILTEPRNSLTRQYQALLKTDGVQLRFTDDGVEELAALAQRLNHDATDIGARRLHMVLERLLEPVSFRAPEEGGEVVVDAAYVLQRVPEIRAGVEA